MPGPRLTTRLSECVGSIPICMNNARRRGLCLVLAAPSGTGKSTGVSKLLTVEPELAPSVSVTTRQPRLGERDGRDYYFQSDTEFARMVAREDLLEHAVVFGKSYGTPRAPVMAALAEGRDVILDIDWQGWRQLRPRLPGDSVGVFILPPSLKVLAERLRGRSSESAEEVARRMGAARNEVLHWAEFDHVVVNSALERCVFDVRAILHAARSTVGRNLEAGRLAASMTSDVPGA